VGHCDYLSANKLQQHFPRLSQTFSPLFCTTWDRYFAPLGTTFLLHLGQPFSTAQYQRTILFRNSSPIIQGQNSMNKDTEAKQNKYKENGKAKTGCLKNGTA
jgi:hypothetical protein